MSQTNPNVEEYQDRFEKVREDTIFDAIAKIHELAGVLYELLSSDGDTIPEDRRELTLAIKGLAQEAGNAL